MMMMAKTLWGMVPRTSARTKNRRTKLEEEEEEEDSSAETSDAEPLKAGEAAENKKMPAVMKRPAAAARLTEKYTYGFDRENKLAWRRLAGKRDARHEWAIDVTKSAADADGNEYPTAMFTDGCKYILKTLLWSDYNNILHAPVAGRLWENKQAGFYVVKKPDRSPLLILFGPDEAGTVKQICQLALRHFGDPHVQALLNLLKRAPLPGFLLKDPGAL